MRDFLEALVTHDHALAPGIRAEVWRYTKLFWLNSGGYNNLTARKFVMRLDVEALVAAAETAAAAGARFRTESGEPVAALARRLAPYFLDVTVDPMITCKTPGAGGDILRDSANNLYVGVAMADLEGFEERYPLNSRLVKRDGRLVEEVYRVGGRYGFELSRVVQHVEAAMPYATPSFAAALGALVQWYRSGEERDRTAFDIAWVKATDTPVDTMNGFIEVYMDARGIKGAWEGLVYYVNVEKTSRIQRLAEHAQWFEDRMPIAPAYRKPVVQGVTATAIDVVVEAGDSGPITPIGVNLPNDQRVRELHGSKSVTLSNVTDAYENSTTDEYRHEFTWDEAEFARAKRWGATAGELATEIHEVLGHGSGRMAETVTAQPQELLKEQVLGARGDARRSRGALLLRRSDPGGAGDRAGRTPRRDHPYRVRSVRPKRAGPVAAGARGHAARRRSHAQPPGHRALAAGQHRRHLGAGARRQDLPRARERRALPRTASARCCARCSASRAKATTPRRGRCSIPTACTSTPSCATRSSPGSTA